jgi:tRNA(Ile)-lysidine synthase
MARFAFPKQPHVAVAVSGGADSMALALLAAEWASKNKVRLTALTVDHKLRPEAADEARQVEAWLSARGIAHQTLTWDDGANVRALNRSAQDVARDARYALLTDWARANGCFHILLAHHADDQIETFFMRLARGSGVQGLACMDTQTLWRVTNLYRPLLAFSKEQLIETCRARGQAWIEDPSNTNPKYTRSRFRQSRAILETEGLTRERLLATIAHLQRARAALNHDYAKLDAKACIWSPLGMATLLARRLFAAPDEVSLRLLGNVLRRVSGQIYGPRFERLERLHHTLKAGDVPTATLHGCCVTRRADAITVMREPSAIAESAVLSSHASLIWDGRFDILTGDIPAGWRVRAYQPGDKAFWKTIQGSGGCDSRVLDGIPATLRKTLPVIADENGPVAMPQLDLWRDAPLEHIEVWFIA